MAGTWKLRGYVVESPLGRGASSDVWRARIAATGEPVALKRLDLAGVEAQRRARSEAALLTVLDHPNLVRLHDLVTTADAAVLVLDLADGGSLADLLAARRRLAPGEVITAVAPVAAALAYVHRQAVVHGDVTPANILFTRGGVALLADLGVARLTGDESDAESTPAYIDPAVADGCVPAAPSDVFMLGAVAFHALTGAPPWPAQDAAAALAAARSGALPDVAARLVGSDVPAPMAAVIARALAIDPAQRGTAADLALDLRHSGTPVAVELAAGRVRPAGDPWLHAQTAPPRRAVGPEYGQTTPRAPRREPPGGTRAAYRPRHAADPSAYAAAPAGAGATGGATGGAIGAAAVHGAAGAWGGLRGGRTTPTPGPVGSAAGPAGGPERSAAAPRGAPPPTEAVRRARPVVPRQPHRRVPGARVLTLVAVLVLATAGAGVVVARAGPGPRAAGAHAAGGHVAGGRAAGSAAAGSAAAGSAAAGGRAAAARATSSPAAVRSRVGMPVRPGGPAPPGSGSAALRAWWAAALRGLDAVRARAFATRSPALLAGVYRATTLRADDAALLRLLVPAGCGLAGVLTRYDRLRIAASPDRALVTARARIPATTLRCAKRPARRAAPVGPTAIRLELVRTAAGPRVAAQRAG
ncbi:Serine/threonine protein kinase [Jatrophihabitans endophyticus]|uniref:Serine/threonine protein kinase n=1 Tax=Jatrophihabitans endophyticus TaxID=1206085 RepID=A0A1M5KY51_9ACTN|nr:serine/threonine-protein kinase [Jatrophihabitans endophyticus]SHG57744.1 Serine/threonine protein kinase [Jatrophihabitans endophyticus]